MKKQSYRGNEQKPASKDNLNNFTLKNLYLQKMYTSGQVV